MASTTNFNAFARGIDVAYDRDDYWQEAFEIAMDDAGCGELLKQMSKEQRAEIGGALCGASENEGMASHMPENPLHSENERLSRKLRWQKVLIYCETCNGRGRIITPGPYHSSDSQCWKCHGDGKVHPHGEVMPS